MAEMFEWGGESVLSCDADGPAIDSAQRALDLVGEALGQRASVVALPASRLGPAFFDLRTGIAGELAQKAVNYHLKVAVIGDISRYLEASTALRDWVRESNRRSSVWFEASLESLAARLGGV
jgi:hypothetical protein